MIHGCGCLTDKRRMANSMGRMRKPDTWSRNEQSANRKSWAVVCNSSEPTCRGMWRVLISCHSINTDLCWRFLFPHCWMQSVFFVCLKQDHAPALYPLSWCWHYSFLFPVCTFACPHRRNNLLRWFIKTPLLTQTSSEKCSSSDILTYMNEF